MKRLKNKKRLNFLVLVIVVQVLFLFKGELPLAKGADLFAPGEVQEATPSILQSSINGPRADVVFNNSIGEIGEMEARAIVTGFNTEDKNLYFTWYLKRDDGKDLDGDGRYNENDWKIEAAKISATNGYQGESSGNVSGDDDGYKALPRWTGRNSDPECYVQDYEDGRIYELKKTQEKFSCDSAVCVSERTFSCEDPDNPGTFSSTNACQQREEAPKCKVTNAENFTATGSCTTGALRCGSGLSNVFSSSLTESQMCDRITFGSGGDSCSSLSLTTPTCTFEEESGGNICEHLFPDPGISGENSGDGTFDDDEENFWGTDPNNSSTAGNGNVDEANVIGLGINTFKWKYEKGDQLGLIVEGESIISTKHNDGKKMIMWALSKNKCSAISEAAKERRFYIENSFGFNQGILTIGEIDLNDCLEENLIDLSGVNESGYLDVSLSMSPTEPVNDPIGTGTANKGSVVDVSAILNNAAVSSGINYQWDLEVSSDGTNNPPLWKSITGELTDHGYLTGTGNSEFSFKLNLPYSVFPNEESEQYLRVKVVAMETGDSGREGRATSVFKIRQQEPMLASYQAVYSTASGKLSKGDEVCNSDDPIDFGKTCFVANNDIISVSMPNEKGTLSNFSWKMNGVPLVCDSKLSDECEDGRVSNLAFFPVIGIEGDEIEITGEALESATGIVKKFDKKFQIINPYVKITSTDTNQVWPKQLGYFKKLDGTFEVDLSRTLFQTIENVEAGLKASFYPSSIATSPNTKMLWKINGEEVSEEDTISFPINEGPGGIYNVDLEASYQQPQEIRIALEKIWGISQIQTTEENFEDSIQIEVLESEYDQVVAMKDGVGKFLASVVSNASGQVVFLLRIILTAALLVGVSGLVFSIVPTIGKKE